MQVVDSAPAAGDVLAGNLRRVLDRGRAIEESIGLQSCSKTIRDGDEEQDDGSPAPGSQRRVNHERREREQDAETYSQPHGLSPLKKIKVAEDPQSEDEAGEYETTRKVRMHVVLIPIKPEEPVGPARDPYREPRQNNQHRDKHPIRPRIKESPSERHQRRDV